MLDLEAPEPAYEASDGAGLKRRRDESMTSAAGESSYYENASIFVRRVIDLSDIPKYQQPQPQQQSAASPFALALHTRPLPSSRAETDSQPPIAAAAAVPPPPPVAGNAQQQQLQYNQNYWHQFAASLQTSAGGVGVGVGVSPSASLLADFKPQGGSNSNWSLQHALSPESSLALFNQQAFTHANATQAALYVHQQFQPNLQRVPPSAPSPLALIHMAEASAPTIRSSPTPLKNEMAANALRGSSPAKACAALFGASPALRRSSQLSQQPASPVRMPLPQQHASAPNSPCAKSALAARAPSQLSTCSQGPAGVRPLGLLPAAAAAAAAAAKPSFSASSSQLQSAAPTRRSKRLQNREREKQLVNEGLIQIRVCSTTSIRDLKIQVRMLHSACVQCVRRFA